MCVRSFLFGFGQWPQRMSFDCVGSVNVTGVWLHINLSLNSVQKFSYRMRPVHNFEWKYVNKIDCIQHFNLNSIIHILIWLDFYWTGFTFCIGSMELRSLIILFIIICHWWHHDFGQIFSEAQQVEWRKKLYDLPNELARTRSQMKHAK